MTKSMVPQEKPSGLRDRSKEKIGIYCLNSGGRLNIRNFFDVNPEPRGYTRGFGAQPLQGVRIIHPRAYAGGVLWYGVNDTSMNLEHLCRAVGKLHKIDLAKFFRRRRKGETTWAYFDSTRVTI